MRRGAEEKTRVLDDRDSDATGLMWREAGRTRVKSPAVAVLWTAARNSQLITEVKSDVRRDRVAIPDVVATAETLCFARVLPSSSSVRSDEPRFLE